MSDKNGHRIVYVGLGVMFILFGIAALVYTLYPLRFGPAFTYLNIGTRRPYPALTPLFMGRIWGIGPFLAFFGLFILLVLFLLFVGFIFTWPLRSWRFRHQWRYRFDSAYMILRERYAKGEITKEQYEQMMKDLQSY